MLGARRFGVVVAAVATIASGTLAGCDEGERASKTATTPTETDTQASVGEMAAVLSHDRCTYVGTRSPATGRFTVYVENTSSLDAAFLLVELDARTTRAQFAAYVNDWHLALAAGRTAPRRPWPMRAPVGTQVVAGGRSELPVNGPNRVTYALLCEQGPTADGFVAPQAVYLATFITVGPVPG